MDSFSLKLVILFAHLNVNRVIHDKLQSTVNLSPGEQPGANMAVLSLRKKTKMSILTPFTTQKNSDLVGMDEFMESYLTLYQMTKF